MSRFDDYDYDVYYPNQVELWQANIRRALAGKRGRKALAELREALLPSPRRNSSRARSVRSATRGARRRDTAAGI